MTTTHRNLVIAAASMALGVAAGSASAQNTRRGKVVIDVECGSGLAIVDIR